MKKKSCNSRNILAVSLSLCIAALAGCQPQAAVVKEQKNMAAIEPLQMAALQSGQIAAVDAVQLIDRLAFWPEADRLIASETDGLFLADKSGKTLAHLPGHFEKLDHRTGEQGLLITSINSQSQQVVVVSVSRAKRELSNLQMIPRRDFKVDGVCLYRDEAHNEFVFLVGEEGLGEQWLVAQSEKLLAEPKLVRALSLPPESEHCQVDDSLALLYVNEEGVGFWAYEAHPEAALVRYPVDMIKPFGSIADTAVGMAQLPGGLLALDAGSGELHAYQAEDGKWQSVWQRPLNNLNEPEWISARVANNKTEIIVRDEKGMHQSTLDWVPAVKKAAATLPILTVHTQTDPVPSLGDAADDPAIWVHPKNPAQSLVLGTDKRGGLAVYDLQGKEKQYLAVGRLNNVDVRTDFTWNGEKVDVAVATHRDHNSLQVFAIHRDTGLLTDIGQIATPLTDIYGICMYKDAAGEIYAIPNDKDGRFLQYRLSVASEKIHGDLVREFAVKTQPEGCVANDKTHRLFVGEEDEAVWALDARADAATTLEKVIAVDGERIVDDIEGLAIYNGKARDYLVISSQGNDSYAIIDAEAPYTWRGAFRIGLNAQKGIDGASETDGLEVTSANLGGVWSQGMLVVQDGRKRMPEDRQNYKYLPWSDVAEALKLD